MCGIVGYIGNRVVDRVLIDGLKRLEYRGYDSSGITVINKNKLVTRRSVGKLINLEEIISKQSIKSSIGLGHTRWATHGRPSEENSHPHTDCKGNIVIVHNGIIENYVSLKKKLEPNHEFKSETDTEVLAHLIEDFYNKLKIKNKEDLLHAAVKKAVDLVDGSYALGVMSADNPDVIIAARKSSPLIVGIGDDETFLASDIPAVLSYTNKVIILDDSETAVLKKGGVKVFDSSKKQKNKKVMRISWDPVLAEKGGYKHFMLKEIYEQPEVIRDTLRGRIDIIKGNVFLEDVKLTKEKVKSIKKVLIIACGTSYHAGLIGKFIIEEFTGIPCEVDIGSEFRYRKSLVSKDTLSVFITQSGETADTLASFRELKKKKVPNLAICNAVGSSITREATNIVYTRCGPEIGVASTKAFIGQLVSLYLLGIFLGRRNSFLNVKKTQEILNALVKVPRIVERILKESAKVMEEWATLFINTQSFLYLGRNINYPIALEGALKLKEISYIHAEGYPSGEMKHGPIALIDENMPVLSIATHGSIYAKALANMMEAKARNGIILAIGTKGNKELNKKADYVFYMPKCLDILTPIFNIIPLQLLAYFVAEKRGCDVDQPRNLAKSVTVE